MSHATGAVRFKDGQQLYFEYDGTSDVCIPMLWKTTEEVSENWRSGKWKDCTCGGLDEPVSIFSDYGNGTSWPGRACRACMVITDGLTREALWDADRDDEIVDGIPDWAQSKFGRELRRVAE